MGPLDGAVDVGPSDTTPPRGDITFPMMDAFTQAAETLVRGTASDEVGVVSVTVNGVVADTDDDFATWSANVALGDRETERFCGGASASAADVRNYAAFMRYAMRTSVEADYAIRNMGFRCASDP